MSDFVSVEARVKKLLESFPKLRDDDKLLVRVYWALFDKSPVLFTDDCTHFESIRRVRQKIQEGSNDLKCNAKTAEYREVKKQEILNFVR